MLESNSFDTFKFVDESILQNDLLKFSLLLYVYRLSKMKNEIE